MLLRELLIDFVARDMNDTTDIEVRQYDPEHNTDDLLSKFTGFSFDRTYLQFPTSMLNSYVIYFSHDKGDCDKWNILI